MMTLKRSEDWRLTLTISGHQQTTALAAGLLAEDFEIDTSDRNTSITFAAAKAVDLRSRWNGLARCLIAAEEALKGIARSPEE